MIKNCRFKNVYKGLLNCVKTSEEWSQTDTSIVVLVVDNNSNNSNNINDSFLNRLADTHLRQSVKLERIDQNLNLRQEVIHVILTGNIFYFNKNIKLEVHSHQS